MLFCKRTFEMDTNARWGPAVAGEGLAHALRVQIFATVVGGASGEVGFAPRLYAGEPDELAAGRTCVRHSQIPDEGDEASLPVNRAARTNRRGLGVNRRDLQRPPRGRTRNHRRPRFEAGQGRPAIAGNVPPEQPAVKVGSSLQMRSQMVA